MRIFKSYNQMYLLVQVLFLLNLMITGCTRISYTQDSPIRKPDVTEKNAEIPKGYPLILNFTDQENGWVLFQKSLWKTTDEGNSWKLISHISTKSDNLEDENFTGLFVVNNNSAWLFTKSKLFKTTDGGESWDKKLSFDYKISLFNLYMDKSNRGWLVGSELVNSLEEPFLLHSTDGGESWLKDSHFHLEDYQKGYGGGLHSILLRDNGKGWITSIAKIWLSQDDGRHWNGHYLEIEGEEAYRFIKIQFPNSQLGYAHIGPSRGAIPCELVKTTDGGKSWHHITPTGVSSGVGIDDFTFFDSVNGLVLYADSLYKTTDGGKTWSQMEIDNNIIAEQIFFFNPKVGWIAGRDGVIIKTSDQGATWSHYDIK